MGKNISYEKKGNIAFITLDRPDKLNAINFEMAEDLRIAWKRFKKDDECLVAILSGAGRSFCAGVSIQELPKGKWSISDSILIGNRNIGPKGHNVIKPVIAALHGQVVGGGFWLALECDLRIASEETMFSLPESKLGTPTSFAAFLKGFLPQAVLSELLFVGNPIDAKRAYQLGLVNRVVRQDDLIKEATLLGEQICENAPLAIRAMKEVILKATDVDRQFLQDLTEKIYRPVFESEDLIEGRKAYLEKRKPKWKGK